MLPRGPHPHTGGSLILAQVDTRVWFIERHVINKYEMGVKNPVTGEVTVQELLQIKAWLKRRTAELNLEKLMGSLLEEFKAAAPVQPAIDRPAAKGPKAGMLEISIMDLHLGKRCWGLETGRDYDPEIAQKLFWTALEDLLAKASACPVEEILFVCGNDFFNTDQLGRTTTQGTPQDEAVPWQQSFAVGVRLLVDAIERLRRVAPVRVVMVQGNHDTQRVFFLGSVLASWFRQTADVRVDNTPTQRKYVHYGANLIGFTHGAYEKHPNLPLLMATERAHEWGQSRHREFHLGHFHSRQTKAFTPVADRQAVIIRILPSLCSADSWHSSMGYAGKLAADALFWDREEGCVATFTHSPA